MHPEMKEWFEQRAIEQTRHFVSGLRLGPDELALTADGHLLDPPIYPAYQQNSFEAYADYQGLWVHWYQKESKDSQWERPRRLIRYAELK